MTKPWTFVTILAAAFSLLATLAWLTRPAPPTDLGPRTSLLKPATPTEVRDAIRTAGAPLVLVNIWASWCAPCRREFPLILGLARELRDRGVRLILLSVDEATDFEEAEGVLREMGVDFPTFYKGRQSLNFVTEIYPKWSGAIPATLLFGPNAELLDAWEGDASWDDLKRNLYARAKP